MKKIYQKKNHGNSVFVNSEPIREEQVQNAVKFLSHPKIRGSPVIYRRSFLERKGRIKEEIDKSFRRVPWILDRELKLQAYINHIGINIMGSTPSCYYNAVDYHYANIILTNGQQPLAQVLKPTHVGPMGSSSKMGMISRFNWYHAIFSVLAASGVGTAVLFKVHDVIYEVVYGDGGNVMYHVCVLVIGSHGYGAIKRGCVSDYCAHHGHCSVMIVKKPKIK
ncbi:hypothetical protein OROHE_002700 [Orobanche hederae]